MPGNAVAGPTAPVERPSYWRERTSHFKSLAGHADIVMLGDSLTDGAEWREMFPSLNIVNRGIAGDTTDGVLERLDQVLALHPKQVFIMVGINDVAESKRGVDAVAADYKAIVSKLEQRGVRVVVQSTLPCNEAKGAWKECAALNPQIRRLNARLAALASAKVTYIDLWPRLANGGSLRAEYTYDGIHLNGDGYRQWQSAIEKAMTR